MSLSAEQPTLGRSVELASEDHRPRRADKAYYEDNVKLPGFGHRPDRCYPLTAFGFCENGHPALGRSDCGTRFCPEHWTDSIAKAVEAFVARLAAYRHTQSGWGKRVVHTVASPDQERRWSVRAFYDTRRDAYAALGEVGARGGVCVPHAYRTSDLLEDIWSAMSAEDRAASGGKWAKARELADGDWSAMRELIDPAPHYHALAAADDIDGEAVPRGWVVKNIRGLAPFYLDADAVPISACVEDMGRITNDPREIALEGYRDMAAVGYYLMTHSAVSLTENGHSRAGYTYFGELHPSKFQPAEELTPEEWRIVQEMAASVVGREPDLPGHGMTCPCEGCEADVWPLSDLSEWMDNREWFDGIDARQRNMLRALEVWIVLGVDRPPPSVRRSREALETWLVERGRVLTDADRSPTGAGTSTAFLGNFGSGA